MMPTENATENHVANGKPGHTPTRFGLVLFHTRHALDLSRRQLAAISGVGVQTIASIETGSKPLGPRSPRNILRAVARIDGHLASLLDETLPLLPYRHFHFRISKDRKTLLGVEILHFGSWYLRRTLEFLRQLPPRAVAEMAELAFSRGYTFEIGITATLVDAEQGQEAGSATATEHT